MATKTKKAPAKKPATRKSTSKAKTNGDPMARVSHSIEAAEAAVKDLGAGADKGTRDLVRDLEKALKHARTNAQKVARAVKKDLKRA